MASWIWAIDGNSDEAGGSAGAIARFKTWGASNLSVPELFIDTMASVTVYSVTDMVNKVIAAAGGDKISRLIIYGHGASGVQSVGCGNVGDAASSKKDDFLMVALIDGKLKNGVEPILANLIPHLATDALISLGGCEVGSRPDGEELLKRLSTVLGVPVQAGIFNQMPMFAGYEGPVVTCSGNSCVMRPGFLLSGNARYRK
jgi:hypothetical protein